MKKRIYSKDIRPDLKKLLFEHFAHVFKEGGINSDDFNLIFEDNAKTKVVYHYTSLGTLQSILNRMEAEEKKNNPFNLVLRGTQVEYLNDHMEFKIGSQLLTDSIHDHEKNLSEHENKNIAHNLNEASWKKLATSLDIETLPFITSFSEEKDSLPMWQMYGQGGKGIAIGIEKCDINSTNYKSKPGYPVWCKCEYDKTAYKRFLERHISDIYKYIEFHNNRWQINFYKNVYISEFLCMLKHTAFSYEKEWRLVNTYSTNDVNKDISFLEKDGMVKPYVEHFLHNSLLKKIIVGPSPNQHIICKTVRMMLERAGYETGLSSKKITVIPSIIPYRFI